MDENKKYEYVMDLPEIREFCRFAYLEQLKQRKLCTEEWAEEFTQKTGFVLEILD